MANPPAYQRGYSFAGFQANSPQKPLPGQKVDEELDNLGHTANATASNLIKIQRPDGKLANGIVTSESLAPSLQTGVNPAEPWVPGKQYLVGDVVFDVMAFYRCVEEHISSDDFASDAGKWEMYADFGPIASDAAEARDQAVAAAGTATTAAATASAAANQAVSLVSSIQGVLVLGYAATSAEIQPTIDAVAVAGAGAVFVGPGVHEITQPLRLRPNVELRAAPGTASIKQSAGANLTYLIDFDTYSAHGASLQDIAVDGNRAENSQTIVDRFSVLIGGANDVVVRNCEIHDMPGHGVYASTGLRSIIEDNHIHDNLMYGIYIINPTFGPLNRPIARRNRVENNGWHGILFYQCSKGVIEDNFVSGMRLSGQVVNVSGATVTWVSGPDFSLLVPGNFLIYDGGIEAPIIAKNSNTSLTLSGPFGDGVNLPAATGAADLITTQNSDGTQILRNRVINGASLGISVLADGNGYGDDTNASVLDNYCEGVGSAGYSVQTSGGGSIRFPAFRGNTAIACGLNGTASHDDYNSGLTVSGLIEDVVVQDNRWIGAGSTMAGLTVVAPGGHVRTAGNESNTVDPTIRYGTTAALGAGWGAGAAVTELKVYDDAIYLEVQTTAAAPSAGPSISLTHRAVPVRRKLPSAQCIGLFGAGTLLDFVTFLPDAATDTGLIVAGTPAASTLYRILVRL